MVEATGPATSAYLRKVALGEISVVDAIKAGIKEQEIPISPTPKSALKEDDKDETEDVEEHEEDTKPTSPKSKKNKAKEVQVDTDDSAASSS